MTLDELVGNLETYEMNVENTKRSKGSKGKNLALKVTNEKDESIFDDEDIGLISKNFKKLFKKGMNLRKKPASTKERNTEKTKNSGCYKCGKIDHQINDCPMWEIRMEKGKS